MKKSTIFSKLLFGCGFALVLLNIVLAIYCQNLTQKNAAIENAYCQRAYEIYTQEIYPILSHLALEDVLAYTGPNPNSYGLLLKLGLNSISSYGSISELSQANYTFNVFFNSLSYRLLYIAYPQYFSYATYYDDLPKDAPYQTVIAANQEVKRILDEELAKGKTYAQAFEALEPYMAQFDFALRRA